MPHGIKLVVDVRRNPGSRTNTQYVSMQLASVLADFQIDYQHIPALGGRRGKTKDLSEDVNAFWQNQSFHNYADYALGPEFRSGLEELRRLGNATTCVIMCAEAVWWRCHRRIIADHLIASGEAVFHILGPSVIDRAHLTEGARIGEGRIVSYPSLSGRGSNKKPAAKR